MRLRSHFEKVLEPLLEGFNEPGVTSDATPSIENVGINDGDRETQSGEAFGDPVLPRGSSGKRASDQDDVEEDWVSAESGSIGDDIAALEEELREEEGLLLDGDNGDGEGGVFSGDRVGGEEDAVQKAAWCLFEVLLPRCVGLEGQGLETRLEEPTRFSHRCVGVIFYQVYTRYSNGSSFFVHYWVQELIVRLRPTCSIARDLRFETMPCAQHFSTRDICTSSDYSMNALMCESGVWQRRTAT